MPQLFADAKRICNACECFRLRWLHHLLVSHWFPVSFLQLSSISFGDTMVITNYRVRFYLPFGGIVEIPGTFELIFQLHVMHVV